MKNLSRDNDKYLLSMGISEPKNKYYRSRIPKNIIGDLGPINVFDKLLEERIIFLTGEIDDYICDVIKANLFYLESISNKDIRIYINSGGGSVYSGLGLIDTMEYVKPDIITVNTGLAASMAALMLCCGTAGKRKALKRSRTMIHQPMSGFGGYSQASDMEIDAKEIISLKKEINKIISKRTGQKCDKVEVDADRDYWMNAEESMKYGMIDEIIKNK